MTAESFIAKTLVEWTETRREIKENLPEGMACYCCGTTYGPMRHVIYGAFACQSCLLLIEQEKQR